MSEKKAKKRLPSGGSANPMDVGLLQKLVDLMAANDLNTVDLRDGGKRVVLKRGAVQPVGGTYIPAPAMAAPAHLPGGRPAGAPAPDEDAGLVPIKSPMVGTFYSASSPDAKAFVSVGSAIDEETDVCIIEAMKVFNNIKAECRGTIAKILAENGKPVEFGQTLFLVKPA